MKKKMKKELLYLYISHLKCGVSLEFVAQTPYSIENIKRTAINKN